MNSCFKIHQFHQETTETVFHYHSNNGKMPKGSKPRMQRKANISKSVCGNKLQSSNTHAVLSSRLCWAPLHRAGSTRGKTDNGRQKELSSHTDIRKKQSGQRNKGPGHGHPFWNRWEMCAQTGNWRLMFQRLFIALKEHFHLWSSAAGNDHEYTQRLQNNHGKNTVGGLVGVGGFCLFVCLKFFK